MGDDVGSGNWVDTLCLPVEEGCEWGGERERGEDCLYENCGWFVMRKLKTCIQERSMS